MAFCVGGNPKPMSQRTESDRLLNMGTPDEVRAKISAYLPNVDWADTTWGTYRGDGFSFEFGMRDEPQKTGFMIHVRGGGDAIATLLQFAAPNRWSLLDCSTGEWLDPNEPSQAGWEGFQAFRDRNLPRS
jgi:hypothetical protein